MLALVPAALFALSFSGVDASYAPTYVSCPTDTPLIRRAGTVPAQNQTLGFEEAKYIQRRRADVAPDAFATYLDNVRAASGNVTLPAYLTNILSSKNTSTLPRLAITTSGGGYRAAHFGAGVLAAFDGRNNTAVSKGTGGLLQAVDSLAGLSGGSWLVTSLAQANFPPIYDLALGTPNPEKGGFGGWNAERSVFLPADPSLGISASNQTALNNQFSLGIIGDLAAKRAAGFDVTFGDYWARDLSHHFLNGTTAQNFFDTSASHGADIKFSDIAKTPSFQSYEQPFPIIIATVQDNSGNRSNIVQNAPIPISNEIYEFNPYESGSWDPSIASFTPTAYLGTTLNNGKPVNASACVNGFDNAGFLFGTSSDLFLELNVTTDSLFNSSTNPLAPFFQIINSTFESTQPGQSLDISVYPNPFVGLGTDAYLGKNEAELNLVDGGLDGQVTPYVPFLVKARQVDVIIGIDGSGDTQYNYANGGSVLATKARTELSNLAGSYSFPPVPSNTNTFIGRNLTNHPTFFGCNITDNSSPLVIYIANAPPLSPTAAGRTITNYTTTKIQYSKDETSTFLDGAFDVATRGYPSDPSSSSALSDPKWPACLACAVADRARARAGEERAGVCAECFDRYCWDGVEGVA